MKNGSGWKSRKVWFTLLVFGFAFAILIYGFATGSIECILAAAGLAGGGNLFYNASNAYQAGKFANDGLPPGHPEE